MSEHYIVDLIPRDRWISRKELVRMTGMADRTVRHLIENARRAGYRIVSNTFSGGYKLAADGREWLDFVERERRRAIATFKKVTGLPEEQMNLFETR